MNLHEARAALMEHLPMLRQRGISWAEDAPIPYSYLPDGFAQDMGMAMDALPTTVTDPNSALPALLTTFIDPETFRIVWAPLKAAEILGGEVAKGDWTTDTAMFPVEEMTGEVSTYGDYNNNGRAGLNVNWPQRQNYRFQIFKEYGELEMDRMGLARINWAAGKDRAAAWVMANYHNLTYFYGVGGGLQLYGLLNDPNLTAPLTPALKAYGGTTWVGTGAFAGQRATANEVFADLQSIYTGLVTQAAGVIDQSTPCTLALSATAAASFTNTNEFNVNVYTLIEKNFPRWKIVTAQQYAALTTSNPQGQAGGNLVQLVATEVDGQWVARPAYSQKMRNHAFIKRESSFRQKVSGGTWGTIVRFPVGIAQMLGV